MVWCVLNYHWFAASAFAWAGRDFAHWGSRTYCKGVGIPDTLWHPYVYCDVVPCRCQGGLEKRTSRRQQTLAMVKGKVRRQVTSKVRRQVRSKVRGKTTKARSGHPQKRLRCQCDMWYCAVSLNVSLCSFKLHVFHGIVWYYNVLYIW